MGGRQPDQCSGGEWTEGIFMRGWGAGNLTRVVEESRLMAIL